MQAEFKRQEVNRNNEVLRLKEIDGSKKLKILKEALEEASKYTKITNLKAFSEDFTTYVTKRIINENPAFKELKIRDEKILDLLDINLVKLTSLQVDFESNPVTVLFNKKGNPYTEVKPEEYIFFTKNIEENKKLKTIKDFIKSTSAMEELTPITKHRFTQMTGGLLYVDMMDNKLKINNNVFQNL